MHLVLLDSSNLDNHITLNFVHLCHLVLESGLHLVNLGVLLSELFLELLQLVVDTLNAGGDHGIVAISGKVEMPLELGELALPFAKFFLTLCLFLDSVDEPVLLNISFCESSHGNRIIGNQRNGRCHR